MRTFAWGRGENPACSKLVSFFGRVVIMVLCILPCVATAQGAEAPLSENTGGPRNGVMIRDHTLYFRDGAYRLAYDPRAAAIGERGLVRGLSEDEDDAFEAMMDDDRGVRREMRGDCVEALSLFQRLGDVVRYPLKECIPWSVPAYGWLTTNHTVVGDLLFFTDLDSATSDVLLKSTAGRRDDTRTIARFRKVKAAVALDSTLILHATPTSGAPGLFAIAAGSDTPVRLADEGVWFESPLVTLNGIAYLRASDSAHGDELWRTDGTVEGTRLAVDLRSGPVGSWPTELTVFNGALYLRATGPLGSELYRSDGTAEGTQLVRDLHPRGSGSPSDFVRAADKLYFRARTEQGDDVLWQSDGTMAGTEPVAVEGSHIVNPIGLAWLAGSLYFSIDDPLWGPSLARLSAGELSLISTEALWPSLSVEGWLSSWQMTPLLDVAKDVRDVGGIDWQSAMFVPISGALFITYQTTHPIDLAQHEDRYQIYFDTDRRPSSGYREREPAFDVGAEYVLRGSALYRYSGEETNPWVLVERGAWRYGFGGQQVIEMKLSARARGLLQGARVLLVGDNPIDDDYATVDDD